MVLRINSIGVEIECGIDDEPFETLREQALTDRHLAIHYDGSVHVDDFAHSDSEICYYGKPNKVFEFIEKMFNEYEIGTNRSCGTHVHYRFNDMQKALSIFSSQYFWNAYRRKYIEKFNGKKKYLQRFENDYSEFPNEYDLQSIVEQIRSKSKTSYRYRAINANSFNLNKTLEMRVMPYFESAEEAIDSIKWQNDTITELMNVDKIPAIHSLSRHFESYEDTFETKKEVIVPKNVAMPIGKIISGNILNTKMIVNTPQKIYLKV